MSSFSLMHFAAIGTSSMEHKYLQRLLVSVELQNSLVDLEIEQNKIHNNLFPNHTSSRIKGNAPKLQSFFKTCFEH